MSHIIRAGETLLLLLLFLVFLVFRVDNATPSRRRRRRRAIVGRHLYREFFHPQKKTKFEEDEASSLSLSFRVSPFFSFFFSGGGKNLNKYKKRAKERRGSKSEKTTLIIGADRRDPSSSKREVTTLRSIEKSIRVETQSEKYKRNEFFVFDVLVFGADHVRVLQ